MLRFGDDYETKFDIPWYIQSYVDHGQDRSFALRELYKVYLEMSASPGSLSVLDIGIGPCIDQLVSVAPYASQIILADYAPSNRAALTAWLESKKEARDWTPHFKKIITEVEGKDEMEIEERMSMVREMVKAVVPCDITKDPLLPQEYLHHYDIVQSFLCLQAACETMEDCFACIARMASVVKPGGKIALYFIDHKEVKGMPGKCYYFVGSETFFSLPISAPSVIKALECAGLHDIKLTTEPADPLTNEARYYHGFYFVSATKKE